MPVLAKNQSSYLSAVEKAYSLCEGVTSEDIKKFKSEHLSLLSDCFIMVNNNFSDMTCSVDFDNMVVSSTESINSLIDKVNSSGDVSFLEPTIISNISNVKGDILILTITALGDGFSKDELLKLLLSSPHPDVL